MNCQTAINYLEDYLDDLLNTESRENVQDHFEKCSECHNLYIKEQYLRKTLRSQPVPQANPEFADRIFERAVLKSRRKIYYSLIMRMAACILVFISIGFLFKGFWEPGQFKDPGITMEMNKPEEVRLVFYSAKDLNDVTFILEMPSGIDIIGHEGKREIIWQGELNQGKNLLVLPVIIHGPGSNYMKANLRHGEFKKNFSLFFNVKQPGCTDSNTGLIKSNILSTRST